MKKILCILLSLTMLAGCKVKDTTSMNIILFKAGKADAILIQTNNYNIMIDTGLDKNKDELLNQLEALNINKIDYLFITHFDKDHIGGADTIIDNLEIGEVYTTYKTEDSNDIEEFYTSLSNKNLSANVLTSNKEIKLNDLTLDVYAASLSYEDDLDNNSSLIINLNYLNHNYLFMADAKDERINEYITLHKDKYIFIKMPYHGHYLDSLDKLLSDSDCEYAVITNSKSNPDSEELSQTESLLDSYGISFYETKNGNVSIEVNENGIKVNQN